MAKKQKSRFIGEEQLFKVVTPKQENKGRKKATKPPKE